MRLIAYILVGVALIFAITAAYAQETDQNWRLIYRPMMQTEQSWGLSFNSIDLKCITKNQVLEAAHSFGPMVWLNGTYFDGKNDAYTVTAFGVDFWVQFTGDCASSAKVIQ
jgi:hypothetical protein